jgi:hypothetical protein
MKQEHTDIKIILVQNRIRLIIGFNLYVKQFNFLLEYAIYFNLVVSQVSHVGIF